MMQACTQSCPQCCHRSDQHLWHRETHYIRSVQAPCFFFRSECQLERKKYIYKLIPLNSQKLNTYLSDSSMFNLTYINCICCVFFQYVFSFTIASIKNLNLIPFNKHKARFFFFTLSLLCGNSGNTNSKFKTQANWVCILTSHSILNLSTFTTYSKSVHTMKLGQSFGYKVVHLAWRQCNL